MQKDDFYPFGLSFNSYRRPGEVDQKYLYNGKELMDDLDLGLYDYGARYFDPAIGRWTGPDPMSEMYQAYSPYNYTLNNPVRLIDPNGMWVEEADRFSTNDPNEIRDFISQQQGKDDKGKTYDGGTLDEVTVSAPRAFDGVLGRAADKWRENNLGYSTYGNINFNYTAQKFGTVGVLGISGVWNSSLARTAIPDFISIGGGFTGIALAGGGTSFEANWILRGTEASLLPAITTTQSIGGGYAIDATLNFGSARYLGPVNQINRSMLQTSIGNGDFPTTWGAGGVAAGGKIGITGSYTSTDKGYGIIGNQLNIGLGLPAGSLPVNVAGGVSNTFILYDFFKKRR